MSFLFPANKCEKHFLHGITLVAPTLSIKLITLPLAETIPDALNLVYASPWENPSGLYPLTYTLSPFFSIGIFCMESNFCQVIPPSME